RVRAPLWGRSHGVLALRGKSVRTARGGCLGEDGGYRQRECRLPGGGSSLLSARPGRVFPLLVEVEVPRRLLLEPQAVVLGRLLEEVRGLLEHVLAFRRRCGALGR